MPKIFEVSRERLGPGNLIEAICSNGGIKAVILEKGHTSYGYARIFGTLTRIEVLISQAIGMG